MESDALEAQLDALIAQMSVADRVGQLFMITFHGDDVQFDSDITELIYAYRVGGIALSPRFGNFSNARGVDTVRDVATLTNQLQALAYGNLLPRQSALPTTVEEAWSPFDVVDMQEATGVAAPKLPLLIAVDQWGDDLPATSLRRGVTPLPSEMALGATWDPVLTEQVGAVVGRELRAAGVNLLLGPNLDVLQDPRPDTVGSLGIHLFGGDPYWAGHLGQAYIAGVHDGGDGRVATITRHFPGQGDTDRLPDEEVATIQKSLEEMNRVALPPFRSVTRGPSTILSSDGDPSSTDGMMSSHMRFTAYQGNSQGRATPLSMTPELAMLLAQPDFATWRTAGGIMMSNALGSSAIRRYFSPNQSEFPYRQIALDAFTAGNDLLYLSHFAADDDWEAEKQNIKTTIGFFQERYVADPSFAAQVDAALRRILRLKLRLYAEDDLTGDNANRQQNFLPTLQQVLVHTSDLEPLIDESRQNAYALMGEVARRSITLLYPNLNNLSDAIPSAPRSGDQLLIFTDSRLLRECSDCIAEAAVGPDELANIILRLYGPDATDQIEADQIVSLTFADLAEVLDQETGNPADALESAGLATPTATPIPAGGAVGGQEAGVGAETEPVPIDKQERIDGLIEDSNWIIFAMLDVNVDRYPNSDVVKRFLRQRGDQLDGKRVVVFSLHAPYFLDATEISQLTTYFGVYGKTQPFLEGAIRALFRAFAPEGASPVDVPGTRFASLTERLSADASRAIEMNLSVNDAEVASTSNSGSGGAPPLVQVGDALRARVGPVYDHNGHHVPDGTVVDFLASYEGEATAMTIEPALTRDGIAQRDIFVERGGVLRIAAQVQDATTAEPISIAIQDSTAGVVAVVGDGPVAAVDAASIAEGAAGLADAARPTDDLTRVNIATLTISLLTMAATLGLLLSVQIRIMPRRLVVHSMLWALIFGLAGYILYGLGLFPGGGWLYASLRIWGAAVAVFVSMVFPLLWLQLRPD